MQLKIVFDKIIFDYLVRRQGSPHYLLLPFFSTEDANINFTRQSHIVKALKQKHAYMRDLESMWEGIIEWCISVLAVRWWERFQND
jgi:hypothetical protein